MTEDDVIHVERHIAAKPDAVFRYLTEPGLWARWQGERAELDARVDGVFRVAMPGGQVVEGTFLEVTPTSRVVLTWGWRGHPRVPPGSTTVVIELVPHAEGTLVRLTHRGLPREDIPIHRVGWDTFVPRLAVAAGGGNPGPSPM